MKLKISLRDQQLENAMRHSAKFDYFLLIVLLVLFSLF